MAGVLDTVDQRTKLVGQNRLELLLFRLAGDQVYGINVFKVREVLQCPPLTLMPKRNPVVRGVAHIRGGTIALVDLNQAVGFGPLEDLSKCFVVIAEYNSSVHGFLVSSVERIVNLNWEAMHPPPSGVGDDNYLTAVTEMEGKIVEVIDVEKILSEVAGMEVEVSDGVIDDEVAKDAAQNELKVLIADDSSVARRQIQRCVEKIGLAPVIFNDGKAAHDHLKELSADGINVSEHYVLMISDIEMPEMDGYTLTSSVRADPNLKDLHVVLHTSLSGVFNEAMVKKVGADDFIAKFQPDELARKVVELIEKRSLAK